MPRPLRANYALSNPRVSELLDMGHPTFISRCSGIVAEDQALRARYEELRNHLWSQE
jgi:hypothetical protein